MINLYQILNLHPQANSATIQQALQRYQSAANADPKVVKAVQDWLLVDAVRARYDERLRGEQPHFFQAAERQTQPLAMPTPQAVPQHEPEPEMEAYTPTLWNPNAASIWSFFLSPALGSWLYALNYRELGDEANAQKHMNAVWGLLALYLVFGLITILTGFEFPFATSIIIWSVWYYALAREHITLIKQEFGDDYERKSWGKPIGFTILAYIGYFAAMFVLGLLAMIAGVAHI